MSAFKIFSRFSELLDKSTADLPAINTPLGVALAAKAAAADVPLVIRKIATADVSLTPGDVLYRPDPVLSVALTPGTWIVEGLFFWSNNDDVCGIRAQIGFTGTSDHTLSPLFALAGSSATSNPIAFASQSRPVGVLGATTPRVLIISTTNRNAMVQFIHTVQVSVEGDYAIEWGQGTASATSPVVRKAGSHLVATKMI